MSRQPRRRVRWVRLLIAALVMLSVTTAGLWLTFQRIPSWYRPEPVPVAQYQSVRNTLTRTVNELSAKFVAGEPFEYIVHQDRLNRWLAGRMAIWPGVRQWVPPWLEDPVIVFHDGQIVLAGIASIASVSAVVSLHLTLSAESDGLRVTLHRVQAGSLPVPLDLFRERIEAALAAGQSDRDREEPITAAHLFGEAPLPNQFIWFNGKVPFRITGITAEPGQLRLNIAPEPRPHR